MVYSLNPASPTPPGISGAEKSVAPTQVWRLLNLLENEISVFMDWDVNEQLNG